MSPKSIELGQTYWAGPIGDPNRFRIIGVDGELLEYAHGGEGAVFQAERVATSSETFVALKLLASASTADFQRIYERCLAISQVNHDNIMIQEETFVGAGFWTDVAPNKEDYETVFCVAQWINGFSLYEAVEDSDLKKKLTWISQVARAVQYLHDFRSPLAPNGIIHRDIKPSNVRIRDDDQAVLIDFGMSRPNHGDDLTGGAGTFLWMAPESIGESPTTGTHSDVWGVGALAHWVIAGIPPRLDDTAIIRRKRIEARSLVLGRRTSRMLGRLTASLLETNPQQRPSDLGRWSDRVELLLLRATRRQRLLSEFRRFVSSKTKVVLLVAMTLMAVVGAFFLTLNNPHQAKTSVNHNSLPPGIFYHYKIVIPGSTSGTVSEYKGPSSRNRVAGTLKDHANINIVCQTSGSQVGYPEYTVVWDRLTNGSYVSDFFTTTPTPYDFSHSIPRCPS